MGHSKCTECDETWFFDVKPRRTTCFKCHVRSIRLGFTYGKDDFHGPTIRERQRQIEESNAAAGNSIEPVGRRWI